MFEFSFFSNIKNLFFYFRSPKLDSTAPIISSFSTVKIEKKTSLSYQSKAQSQSNNSSSNSTIHLNENFPSFGANVGMTHYGNMGFDFKKQHLRDSFDMNQSNIGKAKKYSINSYFQNSLLQQQQQQQQNQHQQQQQQQHHHQMQLQQQHYALQQSHQHLLSHQFNYNINGALATSPPTIATANNIKYLGSGLGAPSNASVNPSATAIAAATAASINAHNFDQKMLQHQQKQQQQRYNNSLNKNNSDMTNVSQLNDIIPLMSKRFSFILFVFLFECAQNRGQLGVIIRTNLEKSRLTPFWR